MSIAATTIYNEIMLTLLEAADSGAAEPTSGLWTRAQVMSALNLKQQEFVQRTGIIVDISNSITATDGDWTAATPPTSIDLIEVAYDSPTVGFVVIPRGSTLEADILGASDTLEVDTPDFYTEEATTRQSISFYPAPNAAGTIYYTFVVRPTVLPSPPDSTTFSVPDDFVPYIKYGALAELFGKTGETYDPMRQMVCDKVFELGIEVARSWVGPKQ